MDRFVRLMQEPHFCSFGFDLYIQLQAQKVTGTFEKRAPGPPISIQLLSGKQERQF